MTTYAELSDKITKYTNNVEAEFVAAKDDFIKEAEKRIYLMLDLPFMSANVLGNMSDGNRFLTIPDDVLSIDTMTVVDSNVHYPVRQKAKGFIREAYPDVTDEDRPVYYCFYDHNTVELGPVPDQNYSVELTYRRCPASIVNTSTNWLGDNLGDALLYASLVEAYTFMKGDEDILALYEKRFQEEMMKADAKVAKRAGAGNLYERG